MTCKATQQGFLDRIYYAGETIPDDRVPKGGASWIDCDGKKKVKKAKKADKSEISDVIDKPALKQERIEALEGLYNQLDPTNDDHWTKDGLVNLKALNRINKGDDFKRGDVADTMNRDALLEQLTNG